MSRQKEALGLIVGFTSSAVMGQVFLPERGNYRYDIQDINHSFKSNQQDYLIFRQDQAIPGATYRWNKRRNEYQIKDWFLRDWYLMQDMYELDFNAYLQSEGAATFNLAKKISIRNLVSTRKDSFIIKKYQL
jgi:hypothetical protein